MLKKLCGTTQGRMLKLKKCHSHAEQGIWTLLPGMKRLQGFAEQVLGRSGAEEHAFAEQGIL